MSPILYALSRISFMGGALYEKQESPLQTGFINKIMNTPIKKLNAVSNRGSFKISSSILSYFDRLNLFPVQEDVETF